ncbi:MAG TPA: ABC transporter substrate-binding protein [Pyrinomonadaceae bacterium]|nr:ABC transporter substrate-binding protein [Pyrinomonadaceae bacterium]
MISSSHIVGKQASPKCPALFVFLLISLFLSAGAFAKATLQEPLSPQEKRGKQIYVQGTSASRNEILAYLGEASLEVPGSTMACANCHGLDGQGKPEGSINPSNLTWDSLTKPYGVTLSSGRKHPPYTERGLELAITRGVDPGGNRLPNVMPRYQMSGVDMSDLIAYLKRLGKDRDPGISEINIVIGTVVPTSDALAEMGKAIKAVSIAFFEELNTQGGIYNRRFELRFVETGDTPENTRGRVERFLKDEQVFAMTGAFVAGADKEIVALMEKRQVPLIGPLTLYPQIGFPLNRQVFYLLSGLDGQARALVEFAANQQPTKISSLAIVSPESEANRSLIGAVKDQASKHGMNSVENYVYVTAPLDVDEIAAKVQQKGQETIIFLGTGEAALAFMKKAERLHWSPSLYLFSANAGREVFDAPLSFNHKIFVSFPTLPADQTAEGVREFRALAEKYKLPSNHIVAQLSAYSAAKILVEGLKRAGKDVSREKLITALESLNRFDTGLTPRISYGPNRRIGATGAYVVSIDLEKKQYVPTKEWVDIN